MISRCLTVAHRPIRYGQMANGPMLKQANTERMSFRICRNRFGHKLVATYMRHTKIDIGVCMFINFNWFPVSNIYSVIPKPQERCAGVDGLEKRNRMHLQKNLILNHTFFLRWFYFGFHGFIIYTYYSFLCV